MLLRFCAYTHTIRIDSNDVRWAYVCMRVVVGFLKLQPHFTIAHKLRLYVNKYYNGNNKVQIEFVGECVCVCVRAQWFRVYFVRSNSKHRVRQSKMNLWTPLKRCLYIHFRNAHNERIFYVEAPCNSKIVDSDIVTCLNIYRNRLK